MEYTLQKWKYENNYIGTSYTDYFVVYSRHRDSGILTNSNYDHIKEQLKDCEGYIEVSASHWAVGWIKWIGIHESDTDGIETAQCIIDRLNNYPILDEEDFSNREYEEAEKLADEITKDQENLTDDVFNRVWDGFTKDMNYEQIIDKIMDMGMIEL